MSIRILPHPHILKNEVPQGFIWDMKDQPEDVVAKYKAIVATIVARFIPLYIVNCQFSKTIHKGEELYSFGRCGIRPITSAYAIELHPDCNWELLITIVDKESNQSHVAIVYLV